MKVTKIKQKEYDKDFDEKDSEDDDDEEEQEEEEEEQVQQRGGFPKQSSTLSKEEVGDLIEGHMIRVSQLFQLFRGLK